MDDPIESSEGAGPVSRHESIPGLLKDIRDQTTHLMRQEVALARTEVSEKISKIARNSIYLIAGALVALASLVILLQSLSWLVDMWLENTRWERHSTWLAFLLVGLVAATIGALTARKGAKTIKRENLVPEKTIESLKEDKAWMRRKVS
jgi:hypothetical protein